MFNSGAEILRNNLFKELNQSNLPISTAYYVLKDVLHDLEAVYKKAIIEEQTQENEKEVVQTIPLIEETIVEEENN